MDIKELAIQEAHKMNWRMDEMTLETFATRLIAAYLKEQEPVAWDGAEEWEQLAWNLCAEEGGEESCTELLWDGGPIPEPWGDRWLKYEGEAKRMISLVRKFTAPPTEPAPQQEPLHVGDSQFESWFSTYWSASLRNGSKQIARDAYAAGMGDPLVSPARAAPSSEEVQWRNIKHVVRTLADWAFGGKDDPRWGTAWVAMVNGLTAKDGPTFNLERLAARIPSDCVVVPRDPTEAMILSGNLMQHGVRAAYKSMIAAGEVK